jgi:CheY-like chemotaxis protein
MLIDKPISYEIISLQNQNKDRLLIQLSKIIHDFKNPLQTISILCNNHNLNEEDNHEAKYLKSLSDYLLFMIEDINEFAKRNLSQKIYNSNSHIAIKNEVNLFDAVSFCFDIFKYRQEYDTNKRNVELILNYDMNLPRKVLLDECKLKQIIINLLSNSYKFTNKGFIELNVFYYKKYSDTEIILKFEIKDTGLGMNKNDLNTILNPFCMLDKHKQQNSHGSGLGLSIIKDILQSFSSDLIIDSEENKGTNISFLFKVDYVASSSPLHKKTTFNNITKSMKTVQRLSSDSSNVTVKKDNFLEYDNITNNNGNKKENIEIEDNIDKEGEMINLANSNSNKDSMISFLFNKNSSLSLNNSNLTNELLLNSKKDSGSNPIQVMSKFHTPKEHDEYIDEAISTGRDKERLENLNLFKQLTKHKNNTSSFIKKQSNVSNNFFTVLEESDEDTTAEDLDESISADELAEALADINYIHKQIKAEEILDKNNIDLKIMICDDDSTILKAERRLLESICKEHKKEVYIETCNNGLECVYKIFDDYINRGISYSILLIDENMNYMDGSEAIKILKKLQRDKVINNFLIYSVTAQDDNEIAMKYGCDGVLTKIIPKRVLSALLLSNNLIGKQ